MCRLAKVHRQLRLKPGLKAELAVLGSLVSASLDLPSIIANDKNGQNLWSSFGYEARLTEVVEAESFPASERLLVGYFGGGQMWAKKGWANYQVLQLAKGCIVVISPADEAVSLGSLMSFLALPMPRTGLLW